MKLLSSPAAPLPTRFTVASKCQSVSRGHLEYATYVIAVREPNPEGEGERSTANHSGSILGRYLSSDRES